MWLILELEIHVTSLLCNLQNTVTFLENCSCYLLPCVFPSSNFLQSMSLLLCKCITFSTPVSFFPESLPFIPSAWIVPTSWGQASLILQSPCLRLTAPGPVLCPPLSAFYLPQPSWAPIPCILHLALCYIVMCILYSFLCYSGVLVGVIYNPLRP